MNRTLVIGGTGTVGRQVLSQVSATGAQVRALTRRAAPVGLPSQVEVVPGNLTLPDNRPPTAPSKPFRCEESRILRRTCTMIAC